MPLKVCNLSNQVTRFFFKAYFNKSIHPMRKESKKATPMVTWRKTAEKEIIKMGLTWGKTLTLTHIGSHMG